MAASKKKSKQTTTESQQSKNPKRKRKVTVKESEAADQAEPSTGKSSRWALKLLLMCTCLLLFIGFLPTIIAKTTLKNSLATLLIPDFQGELEIGSADINWFSPVELPQNTAI